MNFGDRALADYTTFTGTHVGDELCTLWRNGRKVQRPCSVIDLGRPAPVQPSRRPLVEDKSADNKQINRSVYRDRIYAVLAEHGEVRLSELVRTVGGSRTTIYNLLNRHAEFEKVRVGTTVRWCLAKNPSPPQPARRGKSKERIASFLNDQGPATVTEIVDNTGYCPDTVRNVLYRKGESDMFRRVGEVKRETGKGGYVMATLWDVGEEESNHG